MVSPIFFYYTFMYYFTLFKKFVFNISVSWSTIQFPTNIKFTFILQYFIYALNIVRFKIIKLFFILHFFFLNIMIINNLINYFIICLTISFILCSLKSLFLLSSWTFSIFFFNIIVPKITKSVLMVLKLINYLFNSFLENFNCWKWFIYTFPLNYVTYYWIKKYKTLRQDWH